MAQPSARTVTFAELAARDDADRLEIVGGELVEKAAPSPDHSWAETKLVETMGPFNRKPGSRGPGGWWIFTEIHVEYLHGEVYCHDAAGWRRDRVPARPTEWPVRIRPDWVCEIVSPKHEKQDLVVKPRVLHDAEVPHYWIVDPVEHLLLVHRWSPDGYTVVQRATSGETVRAEPFDAIELRVGVLFGEDDDA
jgi:Uma2 family endonuclease